MNVFELFATINLDASSYESELDEAEKSTSSFGEKLKSGLETAAKIGTTILTTSAAAVGGITALATKTAGAADEIDKMSQKLGLSREAYQEWDYVLSQSGTDINSLQAGMKTLTNKIDKAASGSDEAAAMFAQLGLSISDLQNLSREEIFERTIYGFQSMEDNAERAALANDLLGRSSVELTPLFNQTTKSTQELIQKTHDLGMIMSDEAVDAGVSLTDTMDTLKRSFAAAGNGLGTTLAPIVEDFANTLIDSIPQIQAFLENLTPIIGELFEGLLPPLMELGEEIFPLVFDLIEQLIPPLTQIMAQIMPIITRLLQMLLPPLIQIISAILPPLISLLQPILNLLQPILDLLQPILDLVTTLIQPIATLLNTILPPLIAVITELINNCLEAVIPIIEWLAEYIGDSLSVVIEAITEGISYCGEAFVDAWDVIKGAWGGVVDFFSGLWAKVKGGAQDAWDGIKSVFSSVTSFFATAFGNAWQAVKNVFSTGGRIFTGIKDGIVSAFKTIVNAIINGINTVVRIPFDAINGMLNKIRNVSILGAHPFRGLWSENPIGVPQIPTLARGGILRKGEVGLLEGNGAEAVVPLENNARWIAKVAEDMKNALSIEDAASAEKLAQAISSATVTVDKPEADDTQKKVLEALQEIKDDFYSNMVQALTDGVRVDWNDRELMRLVQNYG